MKDFKKQLNEFLDKYPFGDSDNIQIESLGTCFMNSGGLYDAWIDGLTKIIGDKPEKVDTKLLETFLYRFSDFISEKIHNDMESGNFKVNPSAKDIKQFDTVLVTTKQDFYPSVCWLVREDKSVELLTFFREKYNEVDPQLGLIPHYINIPSIFVFDN